jgi:hypothetical protein
MSGKGWDLTSTNSLQGAARWMLKNAGPDALAAVIIRVDDLAIAADPLVAPRDTMALLEDRYPELVARLNEERLEALAKIDRKNAKGGVQ